MRRFSEQLNHKAEQATTEIRRATEIDTVLERARTLDEEQRMKARSELRRQFIIHRPKNSLELHEAVRAIYGISIPYTSTHPDFHAPFEWFASVFFGSEEDTVALASRGSGKTEQGSILGDILCSHSPGFDAIHAGGTKVQATVASKNLDKFYQIPELRTGYKEQPATFSAKWKNGSRWDIVTGSMKGVSGQHPCMLTLDEIEFWDREALSQTFEVPVHKVTPHGSYKRRWSAFSTRQRSFGAMNWLVEEAPKRGFKFFQWTVFETMQPCVRCVALDEQPYGDDDARERVCVLWKACKGERAKKSTGWITLQQAQEKCLRLGGPTGREWLTQGLCTRPSSHGLVLHNFEKVGRPDGNLTQWVYAPELDWYVAYDPAEGKKSVLLFFQIYKGKIFIFDELVNPICADATQAKQEFWEHCQRMGYKDPAAVIVDPHRSDAAATWRRGSKSGVGILKKYKTDVPDIRKYGGVGQELDNTIELLRRYICDGSKIRSLFVNEEFCPSLLKSIGEYHYPTNELTNEIEGKRPVSDIYEDEIDALRYLIMWFVSKYLKGSVGDVTIL